MTLLTDIPSHCFRVTPPCERLCPCGFFCCQPNTPDATLSA